MTKQLILSIIASIILFAQLNAQADFPSITLLDASGKRINSGDILDKDRTTAILFFGNWGKPCAEAVRILDSKAKEWERLYNVKSVCIFIGEPMSYYFKEMPSNLNYFIDKDKAFVESNLQVDACPRFILVSPEGEVTFDEKGFFTDERLTVIESELNYRKLLETRISGSYTYNYPNGQTYITGDYFNGELQGQWKVYYENGQLKKIGGYSSGNRTGLWKWFHKNGQLSTIGNYSEGEPTGQWKWYYEDGQLSQIGYFSDGKRTGEWKRYHENGQLGVIGNYNLDKQIGEWKSYYENGQMHIVGTFKDGMGEGQWKWYYEDGLLQQTGYYKNDKQDGEWRTYHSNGKLKKIMYFSDGEPIGKWKEYDENGKLIDVSNHG